MNKKLIYIVAIIAAIFLIVKIIPLLSSDTERIRKIIHDAKSATEKQRLLKCISFVSMDYNDKHGNDRSTLLFIAKNAFREYDDLLIIIEDLKIDILSDSKAVAHLRACGQGKRQPQEKFKYILDTDRVEFDVVFKKEDNDWKVVELDFIEPEDFLQFFKGL
ncbi:hypothetical protein ACFL2Y_05250 [Candidatus Omnitrophota bacterium]